MSQTVGEIGEFALIDAVAAYLGKPDANIVPVGPGDDSAVVITSGNRVVACVDVLNEGRRAEGVQMLDAIPASYRLHRPLASRRR